MFIIGIKGPKAPHCTGCPVHCVVNESYRHTPPKDKTQTVFLTDTTVTFVSVLDDIEERVTVDDPNTSEYDECGDVLYTTGDPRFDTPAQVHSVLVGVLRRDVQTETLRVMTTMTLDDREYWCDKMNYSDRFKEEQTDPLSVRVYRVCFLVGSCFFLPSLPLWRVTRDTINGYLSYISFLCIYESETVLYTVSFWRVEEIYMFLVTVHGNGKEKRKENDDLFMDFHK